MMIVLVAFGVVSGLLASVMVWSATASILASVLGYMVVGSLSVLLFAVAVATRAARTEADEADDERVKG